MASGTETKETLLIFVIKAVLEKRAQPAQLQEALVKARQGLHHEMAEFHKVVDGLEPEVRSQAAGMLETAEDVFGQMESALGEVESFLGDGDENRLFGAGSTLRRGADQLNFLFNELRNFVLSVSGPTPIPNLNLLLRAYEVYVPGKDERGERLLEFVQSERLTALESLDQLEEAPETSEILALKECWDSHLRCMNRLFQALERADRQAVEREIEMAQTTFTRLFEHIPSATMSQRFEGPTCSSQVNLVLSLAEDVAHQVLSDAPLAEALEAVYQAAQESHQDLDQLLQAGTESVMISEQLEAGLDAIEYQLEALNEFKEFFENRENLVLRSAMAKLEESANQLGEVMDRLAELADREGKVVCVRCGHYNPAGRSNCEKCSAPLPNLVHQVGSTIDTGESGDLPQEVSQGPILTSNLVRVYRAVDEVFEGTMDDDTYLAELEWYAGVIEKYSSYDAEEPDWEKLSEEERAEAEEAHRLVEEVQEAFAQGVEEMHQALEILRGFVDSRLKSDLEEGIQRMDSGARKIAAVGEASRRVQNRQAESE